tara:strand:+ start:153 stop:740 length:588 start_codon:yes stop_codon:yes gene_type:complete
LFRSISFIFFLLFLNISLAQKSFYIGIGNISTFGNTSSSGQSFKSSNINDFGLFLGNQFLVNNFFKFNVECFYLNNQLVLAKKNNGNYETRKRFELHQNLGLCLKPGIYKENNSFYFIFSVLGVYVFEKEEYTGRQFDRFDESYGYGFEYSHNIFNNFILSIGYMYSQFETYSSFTNHTMTSFSVIHLTLNYRLY